MSSTRQTQSGELPSREVAAGIAKMFVVELRAMGWAPNPGEEDDLRFLRRTDPEGRVWHKSIKTALMHALTGIIDGELVP